jgi:hypothetical protein
MLISPVSDLRSWPAPFIMRQAYSSSRPNKSNLYVSSVNITSTSPGLRVISIHSAIELDRITLGFWGFQIVQEGEEGRLLTKGLSLRAVCATLKRWA